MDKDEKQVGNVKWGFFLIMASLVILTGLSTYLLLPNLISKTKTDLAVVEAIEGPIKVRPTETGGKAVDHQNLLVVDILKGGTKADDQTETLRPVEPSPEPPPLSLNKNTVSKTTDMVGGSKASPDAKMKKTDKRNGRVLEGAKINELKNAGEQLVAEENTVKEDNIQKIDKSTLKKRVVVIEGDEPLYMIQLAAFRDAKKADEMAKILFEKHKSRLKSVNLKTMTIDAGSNGIFHRIVSAPLPRQDADKMCGILRRSGQDCFLRKYTKANP